MFGFVGSVQRIQLMAWIESHTTLERHQKLILFRKEMHWSTNEAVGFLHRFWWLVMQYAPSGDIATLSPEVIKDQLQMPHDVIACALRAMESTEIKLLVRKGPHLLVHDWTDYAKRYLRDSLYKSHPERWQEVRDLHGLSADDPPTNGRMSAVPTNIKLKRLVDEEEKRKVRKK